jgi:peptide deformylase
MAVKEVLLIGNPKLREKSAEITEFDDDELLNIQIDLKDTLTHLQQTKGLGRALAAPQIGYPKKIFFMQTPKRSLVMINPRIIKKSEETVDVWDSCYCFDLAFFVKIKRYKHIEVEFSTKVGSTIVEKFEGDESELFQHEIDHLNGILATDRLEDNKNIIIRKEWEKRYR